ncbi:response regulator [Erythrobacter sp. THAF29]|uniref:response regulator n=1 Tax=Erythrobacter sp. THAF29 TaxID=2587851 RepID=UPI001268BBD0|nr:response regulator [Erythrobacter sp. THAF29]QFT78465.1 putative transcriptional regulatory protein pdtaR [Erythrobacter sp. THAF29]
MTQRILVAEDEMIVAFDLCDTVEEAGFEVQGPHAGISDAMLDFQKEKPDLAILDIELDDGIVFPLAQKLAAEDVPIIFHSGRHSREEVKARFPDAVTLAKPCPPTMMLQTVNKVLQAA